MVNCEQPSTPWAWLLDADPEGAHEDQPIRTKLDDDDVGLGIEGPLARRDDTFALSYLSWIPDCRKGIA